MTEIRNLQLLDPVDTTYFAPVQNTAGATAKIQLSQIGGGGGGGGAMPTVFIVANSAQTAVPNSSIRYVVEDINADLEFLLPAAPIAWQEVIVVKPKGSALIKLLANGKGIADGGSPGAGYQANFAYAIIAAKGTFGLIWVADLNQGRWQYIYDQLELDGTYN